MSEKDQADIWDPRPCKVDLSCEAGLRILQDADRRVVEDQYGWSHIDISWKGEWWFLARTDLMDDICTFPSGDNIEHYRKLLTRAYGVRLTVKGDKRTFAVIDSFSDG